MNEHLRQLLISQIKKVANDSKTASQNGHPYITGKVRELLLNSLINPLLKQKYCSGSGHVVDYLGNKSKEMDICVYSQNLLPPFFHPISDKFGLFPLESVLACVEVKTNFSKANIKDAYDKFNFLKSNLQLTAGFHTDEGLPLPHLFIQPHFSFFSFGADVTKYKPEYILSVYKEIDPDWDDNPLITSIAIAGRGWMCRTASGWYHMAHDVKNQVSEEIIGYLCTLLHNLDTTEASRGLPRIGYYLTNGHQMDLIRDGKKVRNTRKTNQPGFQTIDPPKDVGGVSFTILD